MINFIYQLPVGAQLLLALLVPFVGSMLIGPRLIAILRAMKAGQPIREASKGVLAPEHSAKVGTPTMGGLMIIGLIMLTSILFLDMGNPKLQCCLLVMGVTGILGFLDDWAKITKKSTDGVSGWFKIALQAVASLGCAGYLWYLDPTIARVLIPFYGIVDLGMFFIPFAMLVIIGASNAVNLTDGLDGLASGCMVVSCLAFLSLCLTFGEVALANYLLCIAAACLGFLWFNAYPAKVFMGDTGSLSLGGALGTVAVCTHTELLLVIIGGVFVAEATSVMIQVGWFKVSRKLYGEGRRFFRMAPIHHHFEKCGWSETQVCVRFWIIAFFLAVLGLILAPAAFM